MRLRALADDTRTLVLFEAPHRVAEARSRDGRGLGPAAPRRGVPGDDQDLRGGPPRPAGRAAAWAAGGVRGEMTVVVGGAPEPGPARSGGPGGLGPRGPGAGGGRRDASRRSRPSRRRPAWTGRTSTTRSWPPSTGRARSGAPTRRIPGCPRRSRQGVLRHDADLLRQRRPPHRARVHDDGRRRPDPVAPAARRGRVVPDRRRRARHQGAAGGRGRRRHPAGVGRPPGRRRRGSRCCGRSTPPTTTSSAPPSARHREGVQRFWEVVRDDGHVYASPYEGPYCVGCEEFKLPGDLLDGAGEFVGQKVCPDARPPGRAARRAELVLPALRLHRRAARALRGRTPTRCEPASAPTTRSSRSSSRAWPTSRCRARACRGASRCRGTTEQVVYVWFDALLNYVTAVGYGAKPASPERSSSPRRGRPTCTWSARTSCDSTPSTGRRC